jgi:hypothetical protein
MPSDTNNKPSLLDFVRYLQRHLYELADNENGNFTQEEKYKLNKLSGAVETLAVFAEEFGDKELWFIADDFIYAVNESLMGAPFKGKSEMDRSAYKLEEYEKLTKRS